LLWLSGMTTFWSRCARFLRELGCDLTGSPRPPRPRVARYPPDQFDREYEALLARMARSLSTLPPQR